MKTLVVISLIFATFQLALCFKTFSEIGDFKRCYDSNENNRLTEEKVNGQKYPLPSSIETFISLIERLESSYQSLQTHELVRRLLVTFRVDNIPNDFLFEDPEWEKNNKYEKAFFSIDSFNVAWRADDLTEDEQCALHFMLSHNINDTLRGTENEESIGSDKKISKHPRENGVVSILGQKKQAVALGKVLLGIYAGLLGNNRDIDAAELGRKLGLNTDNLSGVKLNRLISVTIADLINLYVKKGNVKSGEIAFMPNGEWQDVSCAIEYFLDDNNQRIISNSLIRGAVDGLIIGKKIEENINYFRQLRLSTILRMYYSSTGLLDEGISSKADLRSEDQWCRRSEKFRSFVSLGEEVLNYLKLYNNIPKTSQTTDLLNNINAVLNYIQGSTDIFNENTDEPNLCGRADSVNDKCKTPVDIFAILDWQPSDQQKTLQTDLLGILSNDLDIRPHGNSLGAYTYFKSSQNNGLHIIANNTGIAGCASCYAKYFRMIGSSTRQGEVEVLNYLNQTLTEFNENQLQNLQNQDGVNIAAPAKVVLLFNFGNPTDDYRLRNAVWEITKNFREVTVLAIGPKKENLHVFTENDDTNIFTDTVSATALASKLKPRICKAPAEFQFIDCYRSNKGTEADNKKTGFIPLNKKQYWAMYPKYFLQSFNIKMKFKALNGAHIKVCFSRYYFRILEDGAQYKDCKDASEEVEFWQANPCHKRNEHNCDPFYFSIEGVKPGSTLCQSIYCRNPKDIEFEFSHEGISCNYASFITSSSLLVFAVFFFTFIKRDIF